jgi:hypothetical protein
MSVQNQRTAQQSGHQTAQQSGRQTTNDKFDAVLNSIVGQNIAAYGKNYHNIYSLLSVPLPGETPGDIVREAKRVEKMQDN